MSFTNQPVGKGASVPDARVSARFAYWFEVKTARSAIDRDQLAEHLKCLDGSGVEERLFVITPDPAQPSAVAGLNDSRAVWFNFRALSDAIDAALAEPVDIVAEQARFLLRELRAMLADDGLLGGEDVGIVAASRAYPEYLIHAAYVCQPNRSFRRDLTHLGFYSGGQIQPHVASILQREDAVPFTPEEAARRRTSGELDHRIADVIEAMLEARIRQIGNEYGVFILSAKDGAGTVRLAAPIVSDARDRNGKPTAWTQHQRYVRLANLTRPGVRRTSELGGE